MKNKSVASYEQGFSFLKSNCEKIPEMIIIDFEQASYIAFSNIFPETRIFGCFFHFCQNIYRFIQKNNLVKDYKSNSFFRLDVKIIMAFSFLPLDQIQKNVEIYEYRIKTKLYFDKIWKIWKWFKDTYLKNDINQKTVFNVAFWTSYDRILSSAPLTTNAIEGWHRALNFNIRISHPNVLVLISELIKEQNKVEYFIIKLLHDFVDNAKNENLILSQDYKVYLEKYGEFVDLEFLEFMAGKFEIKTD